MYNQKIFDAAINAGGYFTQLLTKLGFNSSEASRITESMKNDGMFDGSKIRGVGLDESGTAIVYPDTGIQNDMNQYVVRFEGPAYESFKNSIAAAMHAEDTTLQNKDTSIQNLLSDVTPSNGGPVREDPPYPPSDPGINTGGPVREDPPFPPSDPGINTGGPVREDPPFPPSDPGINTGGPVREDPPFPPSDPTERPHGNHMYPQTNLQPPVVDETESLRMQQEKLASITGGPVREDPPLPPAAEGMAFDPGHNESSELGSSNIGYGNYSDNPAGTAGVDIPS